MQQRKFDKAMVEFQRAVDQSTGAAFAIGLFGHCHALAGEKNEALRRLDKLQELSCASGSPHFLAWIHMGLGDIDETFRFLRVAYERRSNWLAWLHPDSGFDPARFQELPTQVALT